MGLWTKLIEIISPFSPIASELRIIRELYELELAWRQPGDSRRRMNTDNSRVFLLGFSEISDHRVLQPRTTASARRACPRRIGIGAGGGRFTSIAGSLHRS
jgi:hypothetical protein